MLRNIIGTISTRLLSAFISLATILLTGWFLGATKMGVVSLIILAVTLVQMLNNFVGGGVLVYLYPRKDFIQLFLPSYIWSIVTAVGGTLILHWSHRIPVGYTIDVLAISLILSFASVNYMILMGQERIKAYNLINLVQVISFIVVLLIWLLLLKTREVQSYLVGLYFSYGIALVLSFVVATRKVKWGNLSETRTVIKEIFKLGTIMQVGNIFQFFNYRVSYYFIEFFMGIRSVGIYTMGVQLSESIWLVSKSIHLVQYSRISNQQDQDYAARITLTLLKISFIITLLALGFLYLLLVYCFPYIFKPEFSPIKSIMAYLAFGILTFSISIILSPYFSGLGKPIHNTISAAISLVFTVGLCWILIPLWGFAGAALSATVSYTIATIYQFLVFIRLSGMKTKDFLLTKQDISTLIQQTKALTKKSRKGCRIGG